MTETELQAIEARRQCCLGTGRAKDTEASLADIPALCAEVRRLQALVRAAYEEGANDHAHGAPDLDFWWKVSESRRAVEAP